MIEILNFHQGQAETPYMTNGVFAKTQNIDIFSQKGIARINYLPVDKDGDNEIADMPVSIARKDDSNNILYIGSQDNVVQEYAISTGAVTNLGSGGKFVTYWKGSILGAGTGVGNIKYHASGTTWTNIDGTSATLAGEHFWFKSSYNDILYICNGRSIGTIQEDTDFDPTASASFTYTQSALALPEGYLSYSIADLNDRLVIAGVKSKSSATPELTPETAIFIWDRITATTTAQIFFIPEADMTTMVNIGNDIYITGGENGRIYKLSESGLQFFAQIPFDLDNDKKVKIGRFGH